MTTHSVCQPGRPGPQGDSQVGSPGLAFFHRTKSRGERFSSSGLDPGPRAQRVEALAGQEAVAGDPVDREVDAVGRLVGDAAVHQVGHEGRPCRSTYSVAWGMTVGRLTPECVDGLPPDASNSRATSVLGAALLDGPGDDLVVDVGDVGDVADLEAARTRGSDGGRRRPGR